MLSVTAAAAYFTYSTLMYKQSTWSKQETHMRAKREKYAVAAWFFQVKKSELHFRHSVSALHNLLEKFTFLKISMCLSALPHEVHFSKTLHSQLPQCHWLQWHIILVRHSCSKWNAKLKHRKNETLWCWSVPQPLILPVSHGIPHGKIWQNPKHCGVPGCWSIYLSIISVIQLPVVQVLFSSGDMLKRS